VKAIPALFGLIVLLATCPAMIVPKSRVAVVGEMLIPRRTVAWTVTEAFALICAAAAAGMPNRAAAMKR
jgi:hypothetical protein